MVGEKGTIKEHLKGRKETQNGPVHDVEKEDHRGGDKENQNRALRIRVGGHIGVLCTTRKDM